MLTEYLPMLPTKIRLDGATPKVPVKLIETIKKAVLLRNQVVHGKSPRISSGTLHGIVEAIHDCLYLFDCYSGHRWAWDRISIETQRLLVQESSGKVDASEKSQSERNRPTK